MHQKQLVNAFNQHEIAQGRAVAGGLEQALKRCHARICYIVDMWTATGIQEQPTQGKVLKSLATYWWDRRPKLNEWMKDWLKKQQPAPDESAGSAQHPASRAFVQYIHENHAKDGWPVHDEDIDVNLLHAVYFPEEISRRAGRRRWKQAASAPGEQRQPARCGLRQRQRVGAAAIEMQMKTQNRAGRTCSRLLPRGPAGGGCQGARSGRRRQRLQRQP